MQVASIMNRHFTTVQVDARLGDIETHFSRLKVRHVLVLEQRQLAGIITPRDLYGALSPFLGTMAETARDLATRKRRAHHIMSRNLVTVVQNTPIVEAARIFLRRDVSCLPVLSEEGALVGLVTWKDLIKHVVKTAKPQPTQTSWT